MTKEEYLRLRLAEYIPATLFNSPRRVRRAYLMKEILMLKPSGNRILVKRIDAPKPQSSLIEIPDTVESEESLYALVLAVGNKVQEAVEPGQVVVLAKYVGTPVTVDLDGEELEAMVVVMDDVLAVDEEASA